MFYSQLILAKKGPLGTIWIAAHLNSKLRKNQIHETNIIASVDSILHPEVPIALRLSGQLLLGVVRIYNKKVQYLYADVNEALVKIKQAFRPGAVDLPPDAATAPFNTITNPENFDLPDIDFFDNPATPAPSFATPADHVDRNVTTRDAITLAEPPRDTVASQIHEDERFQEGDAMDLDQEPEILRHAAPADTPNEPYMEGLEEDEIAPPMDFDKPPPATPQATPGSDLHMEETPAADSAQPVNFDEDFPMGDQSDNEEQEPAPRGGAEREHPPQEKTATEEGVEGESAKQGGVVEEIYEEPELQLPSLLVEEEPTPEEAPTPGGVTPEAPTPTGGDKAKGFKVPPPVKRRKLLIDETTTIPSASMREALSSTADLMRKRRKAAHTPKQLKVQSWLQPSGQALTAFRAPATQGVNGLVSDLLQSMLVPGKPQRTKKGQQEQPQPETAVPEEPPGTPPRASTPQEEPLMSPGLAGGDTPTPAKGPPREETPLGDGVPTPGPEQGPGRELTPPGAQEAVPAGEVPADGGEQQRVANGEAVPQANGVMENVQADGIQQEEGPDLEFLNAERPSGQQTQASEDPEQSQAAEGPAEGTWSSRTRAVASFLKETFQRKGGSLSAKAAPEVQVTVHGLLTNRGRKEAARLYFEVLVLKTRDYIHVEQAEPYADIAVLPRQKLMSSSL